MSTETQTLDVASIKALSISRVSVSPGNNQGNDNSFSPDISANGRYIAFRSDANNLVANDTNGFSDLFVYDTQTGTTRRVSIGTGGIEGNDSVNGSPSISADGNFVVFESFASNLVANDTNSFSDIFVYDSLTGSTRRISVNSQGDQGNDVSASPVISSNGRYVAFESYSSNLVGNDTNGSNDIFVRDTLTGTTRRISLSSTGDEANNSSFSPAISADGRFVTFDSFADNLVANDTNNTRDVFVYDTQTSTNRRISVSSTGAEGNEFSYNPVISGSGRFVVFESLASNLVDNDTNNAADIFLYDTQTNAIRRISVDSQGNQGNDASSSPAISADGRYVTFSSSASNLVINDTNNTADIFLYDTQTNTTKRLTVDSEGNQGNDFSYNPAISTNGNYIAFETYASNLVTGDTNNSRDIFVYDNLPIIGIAAIDPSASESGDVGIFRIGRSGDLSSPLQVTYTISGTATNGTDFTPTLTGTATIDTNQSFVDIAIAPVNDNLFNESDETVTLTLAKAQNYKLGLSNTSATVTIINNGNQAPTNLALSATTVNENVPVGTEIGTFSTTDPDTVDQFAYSLVAGDGDTDNSFFTIDSNKLKIASSPDFESKSSYKLRIRTTDKGGLFFDQAFNISVNDIDESPINSGGNPTPVKPDTNNQSTDNNNQSTGNNNTPVPETKATTSELTKIAFDVFNLKSINNSSQTKLSVKLTGYNSQRVNELGVFTVDDAQGRINGIAPDTAGYTEAALNRSQVIFSALAKTPNGFNADLTRKLLVNSDANLKFYLVSDSTTDTVTSDNTSLSKVIFPSTTNFKVESLNDGAFSLAWKDPSNQTGNFNDFAVRVKATDEDITLGTNLQGKLQNELIDLRQVNTSVKADFILNREAIFNNFIGFYKIADDKGGIDTNGDGITDFGPGDTGYAQAAVSGRIGGLDLTVSNEATANFTGTLNGGFLYAPFIIINNTPDALLDNNPNNDPQVYFSFLGANSDKTDHIRLLGDNTFGFEDLVSGGDKDYNDMTVQIKLSYA
jgi:Tol biopolymer transport system component